MSMKRVASRDSFNGIQDVMFQKLKLLTALQSHLGENSKSYT
jgi:hypothetical protein